MPGTFGIYGGLEHSNSTARADSVTRAANKAEQAGRKIKALEANLAKTLMICESLWELLQEKTGLTIEDLHKKLYEIDMRDGVLDGTNQRKPTKCPNCNHMVSARHPACIYCGCIMDKSVFTMD
jgi:hypothetical protein